ncbi:MAG: hypothetical protein ACK5L3_10550 [Oscillospiraceae bacterium]
MPSGCRYHPRCAYCQDICKEKVPEYRKLDDSGEHWIRCHFPKI